MNAYTIIQKKRDGHELSQEEISWFIQGLLEGHVADYQMSALLMAIFLKGMTTQETAFLTQVMLESGHIFDFQEAHFVDKHSTGGVGDKTSFIIAPLAHACGVHVPMIAGRGLGHTGGTIDKIESVKGYKTKISLKRFEELVKNEGLALMGQTEKIAPADRILYALRDVTATIDSIPLITASIMSKKLAEGAKGIVMDIKTGQGAFMDKSSEAKALAKSLRQTAKRFEKNMFTVISDMNQPLGCYVGNSLEIIESVEILKGKGAKDLQELSLHLAGAMIFLAKKAQTLRQGIQLAKKALKNGSALKSFEKMILNQGGDISFIHDYSKLPVAKEVTHINSLKEGYIKSIDCLSIGNHCVSLGGGRKLLKDKVDPSVGFIFRKKVGQKVKIGETIVEVYHHQKQHNLVKQIEQDMLNQNIKVTSREVKAPLLIKDSKVIWSS